MLIPPAQPDVLGFLRRSARVAPLRMAVAHPGGSISYVQLQARVDALANTLRTLLGTARREPVAVVIEHDPEVPELYLGVMAAGHAVVPISSRLPDEAIARIVAKAGARIGILAPSIAARRAAIASVAADARWMVYGGDAVMKPLPEREVSLPDGTAMVCFTSGTTGEPKGVVLTHLNLVVHGLTAATVYRHSGDNVIVNPMPLAHFAGASRVILATVNAGGHVILPGFQPEQLCRAIEQWQGTHAMIVPTMAADLLTCDMERHDLSSLHTLVYGTAPMPLAAARQLATRMSCGLINGYGLTESSALATALEPEDHRRALAENDEALLGSIGHAAPGVELRVLDRDLKDVGIGGVGQIALRGLKISPGYLDNPRETAAKFVTGGWLLTGDQGKLLPDDNVTLLGRLDDMIISGGLNVQPGEVEREAVLISGLAQCAAFGVASERWGQEVRLAVVAAPGARLEAEAIRQFLRTRLDPYKVPKQIHLVDALPRTSVGKVQRFRLAEQWGDGGLANPRKNEA